MPNTAILPLAARATADKPLLGLTILLVEDSRFSSEAVRIMSLRSGARLRRADCITSARRHMRLYRPSIVIVDVGLPDGSGLDLIRELNTARPRVQALIGTSADDAMEPDTIQAGADQFLAKPYHSVGVFQQMILNILPGNAPHRGPRLIDTGKIEPDMVVYRDDLHHAKNLFSQNPNSAMRHYLRQFLLGVARAVDDVDLINAAHQSDFVRMQNIVNQRLSEISPI